MRVLFVFDKCVAEGTRFNGFLDFHVFKRREGFYKFMKFERV